MHTHTLPFSSGSPNKPKDEALESDGMKKQERRCQRQDVRLLPIKHIVLK